MILIQLTLKSILFWQNPNNSILVKLNIDIYVKTVRHSLSLSKGTPSIFQTYHYLALWNVSNDCESFVFFFFFSF